MFCDDKASAVVYIPPVPETSRSKKSRRKGNAFGARASNQPAECSLNMTGGDASKARQRPGISKPNASRKLVEARRAAMISEMEIEKLNETMGTIFLDPDQKSP